MSRIIYVDYTGCELAPPLEIDDAPKTHFDEIKAMSVEELAEYLSDIAGWLSEYEGKAHALLKWLKAPVEEVDE